MSFLFLSSIKSGWRIVSLYFLFSVLFCLSSLESRCGKVSIFYFFVLFWFCLLGSVNAPPLVSLMMQRCQVLTDGLQIFWWILNSVSFSNLLLSLMPTSNLNRVPCPWPRGLISLCQVVIDAAFPVGKAGSGGFESRPQHKIYFMNYFSLHQGSFSIPRYWLDWKTQAVSSWH